ncbi:polysaccharide biosynthesis tyrosine autokinase [Flavobacteriaceae bacterium]|nr:polysaccharide biosynthesis tyrosine autokinase [Flavobacteriaceae bacterium]
MNNDLITNNTLQEEETLNLKKKVAYYGFFWPWFVGAILFTLTAAFFYLRYSNTVYESTAQIQIKTDADPASFLTGDLELFGMDKVTVENDMAVITSQHILSQVVQRLDLQTSVYAQGRIKSSLQFNEELPFDVNFDNIETEQEWEMKIANNQAFISNDSINYTLNKGTILDAPYLTINPSDSLFLENQSYLISYTSLNKTVAELRNSLTVSAGSKKGEVINLNIKGTNKQRNKAILNTLIQVLSEDQVADKREISEVSIAFIEDRLKRLSKSIDTISQNTIDYQTDNGIFDPEAQTGNALDNIIKGQQEAFALGIQLEIARALKEQLTAQNKYELLPANVGIDNESVNELVNSYNTMLSQRNNLLISTTEQSPVIQQLSSQLQQAKAAIITGVNRYIEGLEVSQKNYQQMENRTRGLVASLPTKENTLRGYARNFKIVEELYVFLLQRKEEASISYISALPNLKVLSYGVSGELPIAPKGKIIYFVALVFGLLIPFGVLYLIKLLDTKINTRDDLEQGLKGISILGEVPFDENLKKGIKDSRGITAESTRVLRSSLSFLIKKETSNVITVTSTTKGEGKSFVSYNLAASYRALGKKVILVGADLRNPQLHNRMGIERENQGLSTYLADENFNDLDALIKKGADTAEMDYLLSGAIPPNPSELLMRPRMKELLERLKERYDIVLVDSAPLLLVSDTTALLPLSDLVVYVSRAQFSDKNIFPFIKELQNRPNIPPFGMVLNGLIAGPSSGYKYRYSYRYRYSYSYKYNYGYGYGYGSDA